MSYAYEMAHQQTSAYLLMLGIRPSRVAVLQEMALVWDENFDDFIRYILNSHDDWGQSDEGQE